MLNKNSGDTSWFLNSIIVRIMFVAFLKKKVFALEDWFFGVLSFICIKKKCQIIGINIRTGI